MNAPAEDTLEPFGVRRLIDVATGAEFARLTLSDERGFFFGFLLVEFSVDTERLEGEEPDDPLCTPDLVKVTFRCVRDDVALEFLRENIGQRFTFGQYTRTLSSIDTLSDTEMSFTLVQPIRLTRIEAFKECRRMMAREGVTTT